MEKAKSKTRKVVIFRTWCVSRRASHPKLSIFDNYTPLKTETKWFVTKVLQWYMWHGSISFPDVWHCSVAEANHTSVSLPVEGLDLLFGLPLTGKKS